MDPSEPVDAAPPPSSPTQPPPSGGLAPSPAGSPPILPPGPPPPAPPAAPAWGPPAAAPAWGPSAAVPDGATVGWAPPVETPGRYGVPGAPGLVFAGAGPRFVAYIVDTFLVGIVSVIVAAVLATAAEGPAANAAVIVATLGIDFLYFVGFWTTQGRATPGMRLLKLQVGNAYDGRVLDINQALKRWVGLGTPLQLLGVVPAASNAASGLLFLWFIALLISTVTSPTKQGLHDRFANSVIVQPVGAGSGGVILGCLVILALLIIVPLIALIFLGGQIADILSAVGSSV